jgi:hypothetical protein
VPVVTRITMGITELEPMTEEERVMHWRVEELERAGYEAEDVLAIALDPTVDLHLAIDLIHRGCPHELALRILL